MNIRRQVWSLCLCVLFSIALITSTAGSSAAAASLSGVVYDSAGAPVPGAVIEKVGDPSVVTNSSENGSFTLEGLPSWTNYTVKISSTGYSPAYDAVEYATPITPVIDDFNRADQGPPLSSSWLEGWGGGFKVVSQTAASNTAGSRNTTAYNSQFGANQEVYFTVAVKPTGNDTTSVGAYLRMNMTSLNGYMVTYVPQFGPDSIRFWRVTNGAATRLGADIPCEFTAGDKFRVTAEGSLFSIYQYTGGSWRLVATRTESTYMQGGSIGIYGASNTGAVDDFGGGTLPDSRASILPGPLVVFTPEEVAAWGITPDKGVITGTALNSANSTSPLPGVVVTATSLLHPAQPYPVVYSDGTRLGGTATFANGVYKVLNVDDGDTVTISATKQGWSFGRRNIPARGGGVSQGMIYGTAIAPADFPIATSPDNPTESDPEPGKERAVSAAFDGTKYLVGIRGDAVSHNSVTAQFLSSDGTLVGDRIRVGRTGGTPHVSFDGTNFLLTWQDDSSDPYDHIYGQMISKSGELVGSPFIISHATGKQAQSFTPVVFDGSNYFVVWDSMPEPGGCADGYGRFVSTAGTLLGEPIKINSSPCGNGGATVAFDGINILAAWGSEWNTSGAQSYCATVGAGCDLANTWGQLISKSAAGTPGAFTGSNFLINGASAPTSPPTVAFDGTNYLALFRQETVPCTAGKCEGDIYGQLVSKSGTAVGSPITISNATDNQQSAFAAFDGKDYLITWSDGLGGPTSAVTTQGRFMAPIGTFTSPQFTIFSATAGGRVTSTAAPASFNNGKYLLLANWGTPGEPLSPDFEAYANQDVYGAFFGTNSPPGSGNVSGTPNPVNFGNVMVGNRSQPVTITYTNNGPGPITLYRTYWNGDTADFSFSPGGPKPCPELRGTFPAGASCTYVGTFAPLTEGTKRATHLLISGGIDMPVYSLTLNGTGTR